MDKIVFISGSRSIKTLPPVVVASLDRIVRYNYPVILGDCYGVDQITYTYLTDCGYRNVTVYGTGSFPRYPLKEDTPYIRVNPTPHQLKVLRNKYTLKDIRMAETCTYGFIIYDGKSKGSLANIRTLVNNKKPYKLYNQLDDTFKWEGF